MAVSQDMQKLIKLGRLLSSDVVTEGLAVQCQEMIDWQGYFDMLEAQAFIDGQE